MIDANPPRRKPALQVTVNPRYAPPILVASAGRSQAELMSEIFDPPDPRDDGDFPPAQGAAGGVSR